MYHTRYMDINKILDRHELMKGSKSIRLHDLLENEIFRDEVYFQ